MIVSMTLNDIIRKREVSPSKPLTLKIPRLDSVLLDGSVSRSSSPVTSISNTSLNTSQVRSRLKRGFSSIRSIFNSKNEESDTPDSSVIITRSGSRGGFVDATRPPRILQLHLKGSPEKCQSPMSQTGQGIGQVNLNEVAVEFHNPGSAFNIKRRLSQRLLCPFTSNPTIVIKPQLRERPSLQSFCGTFSGESEHDLKTDRTSLGTTLTVSRCSEDGRDEFHTVYNGHCGTGKIQSAEQTCSHGRNQSVQRKLTPIAENISYNDLTIKTVEATATAKTFLEIHFNGLLYKSSPRSVRLRMVKQTMHQMNLPINLRSKITRAWLRDESDNLRTNRVLKRESNNNVKIGDYEIIKVLGKGSFGVVRLVKERPREGRMIDLSTVNKPNLSRKSSVATLVKSFTYRKPPMTTKKYVYAMKVIRKSDMIRNAQEGHLRAERDFLVAAEGSRWVIPLLAAFQDVQFLYLVMDFCIGGDFLSLLIRKNVLSEEITKWYVAEMILCVEEAHRMKWIHRDVKPDNFLIGADGHLKISDFGLAFDRGWQHDQKFYHDQRHSLVEKLDIVVEGDDKDRQHEEGKDVSILEDIDPNHNKRDNEQLEDENILDWRNRTQKRKLARSVVGTSQYMAPEVIRGEMYDGRCD